MFNKIDSIRELDNVSIALTDYGFWDLERNETKDITYSYKRMKTFAEVKLNGYPNKETKVVLPDNADIRSGSVVVEYDKPWELEEDGYYCHETTQFVEHFGVDGEEHRFVGAVDFMSQGGAWEENFAVYNSSGDPEKPSPAYLLAGIDFQDFKRLLYSNQVVSGKFSTWLYDQVTDDLKGQKYIDDIASNVGEKVRQVGERVSYEKIIYPLENISQLSGNLNTVVKAIETGKYGTLPLLQRYCAWMNDFKGDNRLLDLDWLLAGGEQGLKNSIGAWFGKEDNPDGFVAKHKESLIQELIGKTIGDNQPYPLLGYFRNYLQNFLEENINCNNQDIVLKDPRSILNGVRDFIASKAQTMLTIGGYANGQYPQNLASYLYQNQMMMGRSKVQSIYSILNARNELLKAVKSAPFFGTYLSWNDLESHHSDNNLFKIGQNVGFARLSGYVDGDNQIDLDWNNTKLWLFGNNGNLGNVNLLKSLVRTQVYRPLFFKHNDYENFTRNQSRYWCKTQKTFQDHEGNEHVLVWDNVFGTVDILGSGLLSKYQDGSIDPNSVQYSTQANTIQYKVVSEPMLVLGDKFIYNDMEFFVTRKSTGTSPRPVKSLYFNEFQEAMETQASKVKIDDNGEFAIGFNHIGYDGDKAYGEVHLKISKDGTLLEVVSPEDAFNTKYRQEIVDNLFNIDGVWYRLIKDNNGKWSGIEYAYVEESLLRQIPVSSDGVAQFSRWGLTFKFNYSEGDTNVQIIKDV